MLCPSSQCSDGAHIIGRAISPTEVTLLADPIPVTIAFSREAAKHRSPEKRFRFAAPCQGSNCANWSGSQCELPDRIKLIISPRKAPDCGIRQRCRWYLESGISICELCSQITTDRDP